VESGNRKGFRSYLRDDLEKAESTVAQYLYRADFLERCLEKPLEEMTSDDLRALKVRLRGGYSSAHIKGVIVVAHHFHQWGALEGKWARNGVMDVKPPKEKNDSPPPLPIEKVRAILAAAQGPLEMRVSHLPAYGGLRTGECAVIGEAEWTDGWLRFVGKGDRRREVPVHPSLEAVREAILAHPYPHKDSLPDAKERIESRVGFRYVTHQLRKSFSTELHNGGVSDLCRKSLMGHSLGLDGVYTLVSQREKREAVPLLPW
jgi:integrase